MGKRSRAYGLMIGITAGFAVWGSVAVQPCAMSGENTEREGIKWERSIETVQGQGKEKLRLHAVSAVLMDGVSGRILYGRGAEFSPYGQHYKNYDLHSGSGKWES